MLMAMLIMCVPADGLFRVHPLVSQALAENKPVVALESTIITHGMPYPHNLRCFMQSMFINACYNHPLDINSVN